LHAFFISPIRVTFPAHLILDLINLIIFREGTNNETPHYAVFSSFLPLPPLRTKYQIFSSATCYQTNLIFILPSVWQNNSLAHHMTEQNPIQWGYFESIWN
jgi:hypothetical protein